MEGTLNELDGKLSIAAIDFNCSLDSCVVFGGDVSNIVSLNGPIKQSQEFCSELKPAEIEKAIHRSFKVCLFPCSDENPASFTITRLIIDKTLKTKEQKKEVYDSPAPVFFRKVLPNAETYEKFSMYELNQVKIDLLSNDISKVNNVTEFSFNMSHISFESDTKNLEYSDSSVTVHTLEKQQTLLKRFLEFRIRSSCILMSVFSHVLHLFDRNSLSMTLNTYDVLESNDQQFTFFDSNGTLFNPSDNEILISIEDNIRLDLHVLSLAKENRFKLFGYSIDIHFLNLEKSIQTIKALDIDSRIQFLKDLNQILSCIALSNRVEKPKAFKMDEFKEWIYLMALLLMLKDDQTSSRINNLLGCSRTCPLDD